jgi:dienelactone hydrolase
MGRNLMAFVGGLLLMVALFGYAATSQERGYDAEVCAGPPLKSVDERDAARDQGYLINSRYDCIDRGSFTAVNERRAAEERARIEGLAAAAAARAAIKLSDARREFQSGISIVGGKAVQLPNPPAQSYTPSYYTNAAGKVLPAYVTSNPNDGYKHPAVIWLSGGDTNTLGEFWMPNSDAHRIVNALRAAGIVVMFPVLRGGNADESGKEFFMGEVDDVLAAADHLSRLGYVNAERVYLAGHGTGATLALLTAEISARFSSVFAFGPVAEVTRYSTSIVPVNFHEHAAQEAKLRSPIHWLHGIESPTYIVEGRQLPSNVQDAEALCAKSDNPKLRCILVDGADHYSVLGAVSTLMAARLAISDQFEFAMRAEDFNRQMVSEAAVR